MLSSGPDAPSLSSVRDSYNEIIQSEAPIDRWHQHFHTEVDRFVREWLAREKGGGRVLNAGSGGKQFEIGRASQVHVDVAPVTLTGVRGAVIADIQQLPFVDSEFDSVICTGSAINYCDAARVISELSRALKPGGLLLLDFERTRSLEFIFTPVFTSQAHVVKTFYRGRDQYIWVYAEGYIRSLLRSFGIHIIATRRIHILSPLLLRLNVTPDAAARLGSWDRWLRWMPLLPKLGCNVIFACEKTR